MRAFLKVKGMCVGVNDAWVDIKKAGQAPHIAPLQPPILAVFRPWGASEGAGRMRLVPRHKGIHSG